jgi:hypothetical protein
MSVPEAREYVENLQGLSSNNKKHLKQLLNTGKIIPGAVLNSTIISLQEIVEENPQGKCKFFLLVNPNFHLPTSFYVRHFIYTTAFIVCLVVVALVNKVIVSIFRHIFCNCNQ